MGSPVNLVLGNGDKHLKQSRLQDFSVSLTEACKAPSGKHLQTPCTKFTGDPIWGFSRTFGAVGVASTVPTSRFHQAAYSTRALNRSSFPRPYICLLTSFSRCTCPSTCPWLHSYSSAARTAWKSEVIPLAKLR